MSAIEFSKNLVGWNPISTKVFVFSDDGFVYEDPEIIEEDGDTVIFLDCQGNEEMGKAVHKAFLTVDEAIKVGKSLRLFVKVGRSLFGWSESTRRSFPKFCYWYVKQRGTRFWGHEVSETEALALCEGTKELRYWTNSNRARLIEV